MESDTKPKQIRHRIQERVNIPKDTKLFIWRECGKICTHCGKPIDYVKDFTLEHAIPLSKGGTNDIVNLVALCETCNIEKDNDIIPPLEYFPYLPERRKKELAILFQTYLESYDWLSFNNLFITDWFTIEFAKYLGKKGRSVMCVPGKAKITHISAEAAYERIDTYRPRLAKNDRHMLATSAEELDCPFYSVKVSGTEIAFFSAYIAESKFICGFDDWDYIIILDWFTSFDNPWRYGIEATIENLIGRILLKIQDTLLHGSTGTAIPIVVRMPESSPFAPGIFQVANASSHKYIKLWIGSITNNLYEGRILHYQYFVCQEKAGKDSLCCLEHKSDGTYYLRGEQVYPKDLQKDLIARLEKARKTMPMLYNK